MDGRIGAVDHAVAGRVEVQRQPARGQDRRLRVIGVPVIAPGHAGFVHQTGQFGGLVAANARLAGPHREGPAVQRQVAHLLAPAPHGLTGFAVPAQSDAVMPRGQQRDYQAIARKFQPRHRRVVMRQSDRCTFHRAGKRGYLRLRRILDLEVAAVHQDRRIAGCGVEHRRVGAVTQDQTPRKMQVKAAVNCRKAGFQIHLPNPSPALLRQCHKRRANHVCPV